MSNILITGHHGMIGRELKELLKGNTIIGADLMSNDDLRNYNICLMKCQAIDEVYHLAGIKGSPRETEKEPYDFMCPMLQFDTNMIRAAIEAGVKRFLYTSSIAVEHPETDKYPAWAKQTGEMLIEAARIQGCKTKFVIVRPANVYGYEKNPKMVIGSLIKKALTEKELVVWGDGSQVRDFIHAKDVARGMIKAMKEMPKEPVNLCSGKGISIKRIAEIISKETGKKIRYDPSKPTGAKRRVMKLNWDFKPEISIEQGIKYVLVG